jgi:hypothetical protein
MSDSPTEFGPSNPGGSANHSENPEAQLEEIRADLSRERLARHLAGPAAPSEWRAWVLLGAGVVGVSLAVVIGLVTKGVSGLLVLFALQGLLFVVWGGASVVRARDQRRRGTAGRRRGRPGSEARPFPGG